MWLTKMFPCPLPLLRLLREILAFSEVKRLQWNHIDFSSAFDRLKLPLEKPKCSWTGFFFWGGGGCHCNPQEIETASLLFSFVWFCSFDWITASAKGTLILNLILKEQVSGNRKYIRYFLVFLFLWSYFTFTFSAASVIRCCCINEKF